MRCCRGVYVSLSLLCVLLCFFFFFTDPSPTEIYTLSLHDALPIWIGPAHRGQRKLSHALFSLRAGCDPHGLSRSEEHTSELQSHVNLVCRLLLEKKKKKTNAPTTATSNTVVTFRSLINTSTHRAPS